MAQHSLHIIIKEVGEVFRPLAAMDSEHMVTKVFKEIGYELPNNQQFAALPSIVPVTQSLISNIDAFVSATDDDAKMNAIEGLTGEIETTVQAVKNFETEVATLNQSIAGFSNNAPIDQLPIRLLDYLLISYTKKKYKKLYGVLHVISFFDEEALEADPTIFQPEVKLKKINWEYFPKYFSEPHQVFDDTYNWTTEFNSDKFLKRFEILLNSFSLPGGQYPQSENLQLALQNSDNHLKELRMPLFQNGAWPSTYSQFGITLTPAQARNGMKKGIGIFPYFFGTSDFDFDLNEVLEVEFSATTTVDAGIGLVIRPPFSPTIFENIFSSPQDAATFLAEMVLKTKENDNQEYILIGEANGSRLSVKGTELKVAALKEASRSDFGFEYTLDTLKIVIGGGEGDGFLNEMLPEEGIQASFSMTLGYSLLNGFYFLGSGSLEIVVASHIQLGPLDINNLTLGLSPSGEGIGLTTSAGLKLELGPFVAVVEGLGLRSDLTFPDNGGNLGPANLGLGFKPPTGIGLSLDASVVKGGGYLFFDTEKEEYGGALELVIAETVSVVAIGLITTRFPDGSKGFSLLLLISVEFSPGIALGMGFFLTGLGGMIGINRTVSVDALRDGVKQGSVDHILFPTDVVENIQRIITDLREFFPPLRDQFIIGIMAKISWGVPTLLSVEFGLAVEFANPVRIAILGVIKLVLPTEDEAIIRIQVNFLGVIDFEEGYLSFDASLYGSKILTFTLEGDMALRIFWGKQKEFLLSVGGFHPSFNAPAYLKVGNMTRLTLNILSGNPRLTLTTYFAITSNTVQFGAQIDFYFAVSKFKVIGYFGFDVLFQFSPFRFMASIRAGVEVKLGSTTILSIKLAFELQGPTPWIANGTASFKILFISIDVKFSHTWGERREDALPDIAVLPKVIEALEQSRNWISELPTNRYLLTTLKSVDLQEGDVLLHSVGSLNVKQTVLPAGLQINKFGNYTPSDINKIEFTQISINQEAVDHELTKDSFAPAEFIEMVDADKLSSPSYKEEYSGIKAKATEALQMNYGINRLVNYELRVSDYDRSSETPYLLYQPIFGSINDEKSIFKKMTRGGSVAQSKLSKETSNKQFKNEKAVFLNEEKFTVANVDTLERVELDGFTGGSKTEADTYLKTILSQNPKLKGQLQIVSEFELT